METSNSLRNNTSPPREWKLVELTPILEALRGMRFGSIEIFIQDSRLVQLDRKEKIRSFDK